MKNYVYIVGADDVQIERAMNAIADVDLHPIGFCISENILPLPGHSFEPLQLEDFETPTRCSGSIAFSMSYDLFGEWEWLQELQRTATVAELAAVRMQSLVYELEKLKTFEVPEEKVFNHKPYLSKFSQPKHAGNNFKRSGFPTSGKLARGRI